MAVPAAPVNLDPRIGTDLGSQRVHQLVFDQLLTLTDQLQVVAEPPALAIRLEHPDPLTYIVTLRPGIRFHDGQELTARDVVFTFSSFLDPDFVSPRKDAYRQMASVRAIDDYRAVFKLLEPSASFPKELVMHVVPAGSGAGLQTFPIGTGAYRFVSYRVGQSVELSAYEGYWDGLPQNAGVILRIVPDETRRREALRKGTADLAVNDSNVAIARPNIEGVRLTAPAAFGTLKDVRKRQPYGAAFTGPSDRPADRP